MRILKKIVKGIFSTVFITILMVCFIVGGAVSGGGLFGYNLFKEYQRTTPELDIKKLEPAVPSQILDSKGKLIAEVGAENRVPIAIKDVPKDFLNALISTEDNRFFKHHGFDYIRTISASIKNISSGFGSQGGSTLTQQLIKLTYLNPADQSLKRKTHELTLSKELEDKYSKAEILELYVNKVYMGDGIYGVETASKHFYGKNMNELSLNQIALLAGIPQTPEMLNPYDNPKGAKERRDTVLYRMKETDNITEKQYEKYTKIPITDGLVGRKNSKAKANFNIPKEYQAYIDDVKAEVKSATGLDLERSGLKVTMALDTELQRYSNKLATTTNIIPYADPDMLVGFSIIDNKTGRVVANGSGSRNTKTVAGGYSYATDLQRQAGSTMKPIVSYAPAIEYLKYGGNTTVSDNPYSYADGTVLNNWDFKYQGDISMAQALASSRNTPAVRLYKQVGMTKAMTFGNQLGMNFKETDTVESAPLGSVSNSSPLKMASAYSAFANKGLYAKAHTIVKIQDVNNKVIYQEDKPKPVMKDSTAYVVTSMLQETATKPYGTAYNLVSGNGNEIAVKTGTTNFDKNESDMYGLAGLMPDSWVVAYTPSYSVAVWVGFDSRNKGLNNNEAQYAHKITSNIFKELGIKGEKFEIPKSVVKNKGRYSPK